jgi:hypothetical protein
LLLSLAESQKCANSSSSGVLPDAIEESALYAPKCTNYFSGTSKGIASLTSFLED